MVTLFDDTTTTREIILDNHDWFEIEYVQAGTSANMDAHPDIDWGWQVLSVTLPTPTATNEDLIFRKWANFGAREEQTISNWGKTYSTINSVIVDTRWTDKGGYGCARIVE